MKIALEKHRSRVFLPYSIEIIPPIHSSISMRLYPTSQPILHKYAENVELYMQNSKNRLKTLDLCTIAWYALSIKLVEARVL